MGEESLDVPVWFMIIWIQIHNLPNGFMSDELVSEQLENFFGEFITYDTKSNTCTWRECMKIKINIDV